MRSRGSNCRGRSGPSHVTGDGIATGPRTWQADGSSRGATIGIALGGTQGRNWAEEHGDSQSEPLFSPPTDQRREPCEGCGVSLVRGVAVRTDSTLCSRRHQRPRRSVLVALAVLAATIPIATFPDTEASASTAQTSSTNLARDTRITARAARQEQRIARRAARVARQEQRSATKAARPPTHIVPQVAGISITAPTTPSAPNLPAAVVLDSIRLQDALNRWTAAHPEVGAMTVALRANGHTWSGSASTVTAIDGPDPAATYRVLSITKTITAALILRAVEAGRLTLDGPLPTLNGVDAPLPVGLTVRLLLRHQSGFVDYASAPGFRPDEAVTPKRAVELTLRAGLATAPGTTTVYTNSNYLYLGLLLEQVEGRSYADLVTGLVSPLGLTATHVDPPNRLGWAGFSSGGVMSTVSDISVWGDALFTPGRVLTDASLREMSLFGDGRTGLGVWGYGGSSTPGGNQKFSAIGHHTASGGMFVFPADNFVLVMHAEVAGGDTAEGARSLAEQLRNVISS